MVLSLNFDNISIKELIIKLYEDNEKIKKEIVDLKRWVKNKKKKVIILDWLNNNNILNIDFNIDIFIDEIRLEQSDLECILNSNICNVISNIIINILSSYREKPIRSFDQKDNTLYIYNNYKWEVLSDSDYNTLLTKIYKLILTEFKKWQDINESKLYTEEISEKYIKYVKKIMGGNMTLEQQKEKIHRNLYNLLKLNLQNVIEYEFI